MITQKQYNNLVDRLTVSPNSLTEDECRQLVDVIIKMENMLDISDSDDYFGTEGWRYHFGWC